MVSSPLYNDSLSLLTDLYQLTMAYGYWKTGMAEREAVFHMYFRKHPFKGNYTVTAGLEQALEYITRFRFAKDDVEYLATLEGNDGSALFEDGFLKYLETYSMQCDADAIPEGTIVFPNEPLMRIKGPLIDCQLLETPLLNILNFQSLIATKAARICQATQGEPVVEFGLRRAQGPDGGISASRAAYLGGCMGTSNVLAGKRFGIPVRGTHAHAWVMAFETEREAFEKYARSLPNNCIFLVDTYNTHQGVANAIEAGCLLQTLGHKLGGIRLDSGDMAALSIDARKLLDEAGFTDAAIVASNDLDEYKVEELKGRGAKINVWGIGTNLVTAADQPALGGVYKLGAIRSDDGEWNYRVKVSGDVVKMTTPGILQVRRYAQNGKWIKDLLFDEPTGIGNADEIAGADSTELLVPVIREGKQVYKTPSLTDSRTHCLSQLKQYLDSLAEGKTYPVELEQKLNERKLNMIEKAKSL